MTGPLDHAERVVADVLDPELPQLTLADLGIVRRVTIEDDTVVVVVTPTYSGCPAMTEIQVDIQRQLRVAGYPKVAVRLQLDPPWTTDWITDDGRRKLQAAGITPPAESAPRDGPVPLTLGRRPPDVRCPRCRSTDTQELSRFGATACRALYRCRACAETFDYMKAI
ncbi:MAG TPA: 1,2-phenylacetyl-CoA epoxidase subunit PaaD [Jatrophihabitantaceae bacterium]|nr:1,2-phenylacetyl-CoA epoxidase subunit PaaD [Jatrophihabitantaceae bacterium]